MLCIHILEKRTFETLIEFNEQTWTEFQHIHFIETRPFDDQREKENMQHITFLQNSFLYTATDST
jgi:hypothetical protein